MKVYKKGNELFKIMEDCNPLDPRDGTENFGTMVCFHNRYSLPNDLNLKAKDFVGWVDLKDDLIGDHQAVVILPIYMYDHSGITINTTGFSCPWDSGQVGYIFTTKEKLEAFSVLNEEKAKDMLRHEVEMYDAYLTGNVYGFVICELKTCETCKHTEEEEIDACWGFYGDNFQENGLYDCAGIDIKEWEEVK